MGTNVAKSRGEGLSVVVGQEVKGHGMSKGWKTTGHAGIFQGKFYVELEKNHDDSLIHWGVTEKQMERLTPQTTQV